MDHLINNINEALRLEGIRESLKNGKFGIEKENVRVDYTGKMATTPHPGILGDKFQNPFITTDFSESQVEMITPPLHSIAEVHGFLETLQDVISENLTDELLWPQSLPPLLPQEEEIPIAKFGEKGIHKEKYREELANRYGKERQMLSGIHFNFSLSDRLERKLKKANHCNSDLESFRESVYLKMVRNFMRYRWMLIWLFGESPISDPSFKMKSLKTGKKSFMSCGNAISIRNSSMGYRNIEEFYVDFNSLEDYKKSVSNLIQTGKILAGEELYLPIRLKFDEKSKKISHLEVRILDLDPFEKSGVSKNRLYFTHLFLLYCLFTAENDKYNEAVQKVAANNQDLVACHGLNSELMLMNFDGQETCAKKMLNELFSDITDFARTADLINDSDYQGSIADISNFIENPDQRTSFKVKQRIVEEGFINFHLNKAKQYKEESEMSSFRFHGFEDLELSSQLLMKAALRRGVEFTILDRCENFISLSQGDKTEYVMQATRTSLDNYSSVLMMENKLVTKKILEKGGIRVPAGLDYQDARQARSDFDLFEGKGIVVKPKSTNFGLGITILKENKDEEVYKRAVDIAFEHDGSILIEEFISGREFRFFVINDKVCGILHRVPANVKGDGEKNIRELVEIKNQDPLRGKGYRTPLEKIRLEEAEEMFLKEQGLCFKSVPKKDQVVYLRENSNISTGGDSIDYTDDIHQSYKDIAIESSKALGVQITGLDMMIEDVNQPAAKDNYAIIEMNFNPAIHIHCYPYIGKNRQLNEKILDSLGF
ncbi:bifunctional glutamate--cysteine ligase GshA/glutathione synthetase GshB [Labilibaculum euxinus]|uniref:Glutamate--cysteine ligase n=1 Tax=Labilibaculum euxinus TaxID=2686357 RepID=A0A7M4D7R2_9BACT|nr:bifunctional glutamate--cysteine ligase GshA/glutathione synthetase GshB [Labilibaculum euxinus]MUP38691.1 bifunctional glutamate--cysteine ligase GshA/glutathione synthetase GshB [Labilibaculum euxinus]MVB07896.1 bifunctional glutamate--cysteine ligase GshA/glutathione synthetase GshB [Labilibaculum euxinus]